MSSYNDDSTESNKNRLAMKIPKELDNPIDSMLYSLSDDIAPYFKKLNYTPNGITTLSLIFGIAGLYHMYHREMLPFIIYIFLSFFCDCFDGAYARKYNMVTVNGDKYDHYKDFVVIFISLYILYDRYNITSYPILMIIMAVMFVLQIMFIGCQEKLQSKADKSDSLAFADYITPSKEKCKNNMQYLRYFGPGTIVLSFVIAICYLNNDGKYESTNDNILDINRQYP